MHLNLCRIPDVRSAWVTYNAINRCLSSKARVPGAVDQPDCWPRLKVPLEKQTTSSFSAVAAADKSA
jgi:hypothetical protein